MCPVRPPVQVIKQVQHQESAFVPAMRLGSCQFQTCIAVVNVELSHFQPSGIGTMGVCRQGHNRYIRRIFLSKQDRGYGRK
ncbi:unnamed protein product [Protopolystoma xenopodis]|uniref:Uncharacterized protein n=1 Tax=Protopolystoma xenopodis TaxID=117903 RepID=A0A448WRB8_9PLAT|nr:unnamed protein product [Protopolystoma xenopodis]